MRKRRNVILALAIGSWLTIACSTGSGGLGTLFDGYDSPPNQRDNPGADRQSPTGAFESPPRTGDNPGSQGGGAGGGGTVAEGGGGGGTCPPCDTTLSCTSAGKKTTIPLKTENGQCSAGDGITLDCAGKVLMGGQQIGTWSASGETYAIGVTISGQAQAYVCTKKVATDPVPTSTGTGTGTVPTGTATSPPTDAGTKG